MKITKLSVGTLFVCVACLASSIAIAQTRNIRVRSVQSRVGGPVDATVASAQGAAALFGLLSTFDINNKPISNPNANRADVVTCEVDTHIGSETPETRCFVKAKQEVISLSGQEAESLFKNLKGFFNDEEDAEVIYTLKDEAYSDVVGAKKKIILKNDAEALVGVPSSYSVYNIQCRKMAVNGRFNCTGVR